MIHNRQVRRLYPGLRENVTGRKKTRDGLNWHLLERSSRRTSAGGIHRPPRQLSSYLLSERRFPLPALLSLIFGSVLPFFGAFELIVT